MKLYIHVYDISIQFSCALPQHFFFCFSLLWLYLANSQVSVNGTIGPVAEIIIHGFVATICDIFHDVETILHLP